MEQFDAAVGDIEADAGALDLADVGCAVESFEEAGLCGCGDTDAAVDDFQTYYCAGGGDLEGGGGIWLGVFECVAEEVQEDEVEELRIAVDRGVVGCGLNFDGGVVLVGEVGFLGDALAELQEFDGLQAALHLACVEFSQCQNFLEHGGEAVDLGFDHVEELLAFGIGEEVVGVFEEFRGIKDCGEGGAELVGHEGDEVGFESVDALVFAEAFEHALLDLSTVGDVLHEGDEAGGHALAIADGGDGELRPEDVVVSTS